MIKINLLESITDKPIATSTVVNKKVASPMTRLLLMAFACGALFILFAGFDIISSNMAKANAEKELENQKQIAAQLEAVIKEQNELDQKIKNIDARIEAIKKLRSTQAGPSAVLDSIRERISMVSDLYLESIEQKGDDLVIKGNSPNEGVVTQFGRSLEFSSGLFTSLGIETQRKEIQGTQVVSTDGTAETPRLETVNFTIRCKYAPSKAQLPNSTVAQNQSGMPPSAPPQNGQPSTPAQYPPPQVAQKQ